MSLGVLANLTVEAHPRGSGEYMASPEEEQEPARVGPGQERGEANGVTATALAQEDVGLSVDTVSLTKSQPLPPLCPGERGQLWLLGGE